MYDVFNGEENKKRMMMVMIWFCLGKKGMEKKITMKQLLEFLFIYLFYVFN
jgi:hypothetical protein